jgi:zinc D-Ala-D-Ala carboxypeptidase
VKEMKKILIIAAAVFILGGCSRIEPFVSKIPFWPEGGQAAETPSSEDKEASDTAPAKDGGQAETEKEEQVQDGPVLEAAYFNQITETGGKKVIQNPANNMALVNKEFMLPGSYIPEDLVRPNVSFSFGEQDIEKSYIRKDAAVHLEKMFAAAKQSGIELFAVSGYRSYDRQAVILDAEIQRAGMEKAVQAVAMPGSSEHQSGLAMDISSRSAKLELSEAFGETAEGKWLAENAHKFGFILRYPKGKESITGYQYEPWHFRYVGPAAEEIYAKKLTLEEYFSIVKKI